MRANYYTMFPDGMKAMIALEQAIHASTLEAPLLELIKVRASQINGCGYCLAMHNRDARAGGESQTRLDTIAGWRETPFFTAKEKAALAWCEALTQIADKGAPDELYDELTKHFSDEEISALSMAIVAINGWNRMAVGLGSDPSTLDGLDASPVA